MKITLIALAALSLANLALAGDSKKHPGWRVPYENEPLPVHELPECIQSCMDQKNGKLNFDVFTIPRVRYCRDEFDTMFTWWTYHVDDCVKAACRSEGDAKRSVAWMYKLCGFPNKGRFSGKEDWKNLPSEGASGERRG
ncbi:hypothetical protein ColTof4_11594 [Colletotrichum tofieldiae]|uniref:Uncharacterized protein n=1 Tax=Colletotrichum tofieldiae TaxID=708197 RepID=A0A161VYV7_9PEZI|nr:hypothetical protein CT0861_06122 [Colletotrichum tofieldiae]GKT55996.1 hypothetical protein ColTof3_03335 [Colletotrichum tofieldiae]GKT79171.1 hypothetical protein ColTof4_11594 [Colletotrichum tofieldiae]GKT82332.1 hypothetical protein Ct61P_00182 [Colletotrichum tofieldiae]